MGVSSRLTPQLLHPQGLPLKPITGQQVGLWTRALSTHVPCSKWGEKLETGINNQNWVTVEWTTQHDECPFAGDVQEVVAWRNIRIVGDGQTPTTVPSGSEL